MNIKQIIEENSETLDNEFYTEGDQEEIEGYLVKLVERFGGTEGAGEETFKVFSFEKDGDIEYWKVNGYYQSHYGSDYEYDNAYKVKSVEETIEVWVDFVTGEE